MVIKDGVENEVSGTLLDWRITLWGEAIDADKAELLPLPGSNEDSDENSGITIISTSTARAETTYLPTSTSSDDADVTGNPTDHVTRPVNSKPGNADSPTQTATGLPILRPLVLQLSESNFYDRGFCPRGNRFTCFE